MDERLERDLRVGLAALLDPVVGSHPRWTSSPAAERVLLLPERRRSGRLGLLWAAALVALLLLAAMAASLFMGSRRNESLVVVAPTPTVTPSRHAAPSPAAVAAPPDTMTVARVGHTATLLNDGRVLITGGDFAARGDRPASAELYDPTTGTFAPTGETRSKHRAGHTAILLADGRVLIIGGAPHFDVHWRETWDPATGAFTTPGGEGPDRNSDGSDVLAAGPLPDGRILVQTDDASTAELYEPVSGTVTDTGASTSAHATATLLSDGRVLITGVGSTLAIYDPKAGKLMAAGSLSRDRLDHAAILLKDGRVLIVGGVDRTELLASAEVWDPATGLVSPTGSMATPRAQPVATLLADGRVLVTGGAGAKWDTVFGEWLATAEVYDPATGTFTPTGSMSVVRMGHTATLLHDGTVLIAGGATPILYPIEDPVRRDALATAELYDPATGTFRPVGGS